MEQNYKKRHGPEKGKRLPHDVKFWRSVDKNGPVPQQRPELGPCWLWKKYIHPRGYGIFPATVSSDPRLGPLVPDYPKEKRTIRAHRWSFLDANWYLPPALDHLCRVKHCVRPSHLEDVTNKVNCLRGESIWAKNARKTECNICGAPFVPHTAYGKVIGRRCSKQYGHRFLKEGKANG